MEVAGSQAPNLHRPCQAQNQTRVRPRKGVASLGTASSPRRPTSGWSWGALGGPEGGTLWRAGVESGSLCWGGGRPPHPGALSLPPAQPLRG